MELMTKFAFFEDARARGENHRGIKKLNLIFFEKQFSFIGIL
jgi:hypothetical protein